MLEPSLCQRSYRRRCAVSAVLDCARCAVAEPLFRLQQCRYGVAV